ncbi:hypothetical protein AMECASPLE_039813 [Ameca splendens]|uniref:Uncharacterized protein n=1 Tax=Ameca splendens TaxID=208324 RepID=A0ABV1A3Z2_9TELE
MNTQKYDSIQSYFIHGETSLMFFMGLSSNGLKQSDETESHFLSHTSENDGNNLRSTVILTEKDAYRKTNKKTITQLNLEQVTKIFIHHCSCDLMSFQHMKQLVPV